MELGEKEIGEKNIAIINTYKILQKELDNYLATLMKE